MQARTEALIGAGTLAVLVALGALFGSRRNTLAQEDRRPSVYLTGPFGARGLAEGLGRLGITVHRFRHSMRQLPETGDTLPVAFVLLNPSEPLRSVEAQQLQQWNQDAPENNLVIAGPGAASLMRCYGYHVDWRFFDSVLVRAPNPADAGRWPKVAGVLAATTETLVADSSRIDDAAITTCAVPSIIQVDTLLTTMTGRVAALRLTMEEDGGTVVIISDAGLFRNRALRETPAGPFALGLFSGRYHDVIFEEAHHGFEEGGSLAGATITWSLHSPLGWAMWQVALVGVLALFAGGFRFGAARRVLERKRRSPLEHVRALATALAAARGHDVAIASIIEGLRRRLSPAGQRTRGDWRGWLDRLGGQLRTPRAREAAGTLKTLARPGQSPEGVLKAANAVEDVWEELRP
jgi:Domain of unknown function (DUF4350)